ncbi:MAG: insulinase family protein [Anaeromyxobacter sp.]
MPAARLFLVWNTPEWGNADDDLLSLAAGVLSEGKSSRLYKRLVYDTQLCTAVNASPGTAEEWAPPSTST